MNTKKMRYIDLFAGAGGLSLGLFNAGLQGVFVLQSARQGYIINLNKFLNIYRLFSLDGQMYNIGNTEGRLPCTTYSSATTSVPSSTR